MVLVPKDGSDAVGGGDDSQLSVANKHFEGRAILFKTALQEPTWVKDVLDTCTDVREEARYSRGVIFRTRSAEVRRYERKRDECESDRDGCVKKGHDLKVRNGGE